MRAAMALTMEYQALPEDCQLLRRARSEPALAEYLWLAPTAFQRGGVPTPHRDEPRGYLDLHAEAKALLADRPDLQSANYTLDRYWAVVWDLLPERRLDDDAGAAWTELAVRGGEPIAEHADDPCGGPVRYLTPRQVRDVALNLAALRRDELLVRYDPAEMLGKVYKAQNATPGEEGFEEYWKLILGLRQFYEAAARAGDLVLAILG
jgi:hypothetical protein